MPPSARAKARPKTTPHDPRPDIRDQLRRAIREAVASGRSHYDIAAEAGIHRIQIGRFMASSSADLKGASIAKLCKVLRLELRGFGRASKAA